MKDIVITITCVQTIIDFFQCIKPRQLYPGLFETITRMSLFHQHMNHLPDDHVFIKVSYDHVVNVFVVCEFRVEGENQYFVMCIVELQVEFSDNTKYNITVRYI